MLVSDVVETSVKEPPSELKGLFPPARQLQQTTEFETRTLLYADLPLATFAQVISYHWTK